MAAPDGIACRLMQPHDWPALLALWQDTFGDPPRYAANGIDTFAGTDNVLVAQNEAGTAVAMLLAVPCSLGAQNGVYLYALATRPDCRGQGVMAALMAEGDSLALLRGAVFSVLIPASQKLYGYYRRHGYNNTLVLRHVELAGLPEGPNVPVTAGPPTGEGLAALRRKWLNVSPVTFAGARADLVGQALADEGAQMMESRAGYLVCLAQKDTLLAAELVAGDDAAAQALLRTARDKRGCHSVRLTLPKGSPLFAGRGEERPAAVLKSLDDSFAFDPQSYLRFAMDEPFQFDLPRE